MYKHPVQIETPMLKQLSDDRVFDIELWEGNKAIEITECCDDYYGKTLNKTEFLDLIAELQAIADKMI